MANAGQAWVAKASWLNSMQKTTVNAKKGRKRKGGFIAPQL